MEGPRAPGAHPASDAERTIALVPVRHLERAKSRLGGALDAEERTSLATTFVARTLAALTELCERGDIAGIVVASGDPAVLAFAGGTGATPLPVPGVDLVADLSAAREIAMVQGASAILVVPIDLAAVSAGTLAAVLGAARGAVAGGAPVVALVPDRRGEGTNVLFVSPPRAIAFAFGPDSRARHARAAAAAGAAFVEVGGPLGLDLDTPDDLADAAAAAALAPPVATAGGRR